MSKWKKVKLGDIATYINGCAFKPSDWSNQGVPIVRIQNLTGSFSETNYYDKHYNSKYEINNGDVLISWSASLGVYVWDKGKAILNQHIFKVVFNKIDIDKTYFIFAIKSLLEKMEKQTHGATMKHITKPLFDNMEFPFPPMEEQKKIAARLDAVSDLLAKQKQLLSEQDNLIQSTFYDMFGDPIKNEKGWKIEKLSSVSDSRLGKMLDAKKQNEANQYPYLANYNVQWFCFNLSDVRKMSFDHNEKCEFELKKGDVLVCEGGDVGRCAIWKEQIQECYFQKALHRVRCNPNFLNPIFLMHLFYNISICNGFEKIVGNKATIAHLTGVKLKALEISVPPLELQQKFAAIAEQIEAEKSKIKSAITETQTLFNALMSEYFED